MTGPALPRRALLGATAASLALAARARAAPAIAKGRVLDPAGAGIPDILVSNGEDVVRTGGDGAWQLPVADGESLFVIKPTGWASPADPDTQLPRFAYVHSPNGTPPAPEFRFAGLAPTGPLPASVDFVLHRQDEPTRFDALLLTDPQPESIAELDHVRDDIAAQLTDYPAAFGIGLGDLMFDDLAFYDRYNRIIGTVGIPWHNCPGNHDMNYEAPDDALSRETFKRMYGARHHAFQYGGATFLLLDNVEYLGTDPSRPLSAGHYRGRFGTRQLAFVRNVLAQVPRDDLVVICHHIPLHTLLADEPANSNTDNSDFLAAIASHPNCISFSGHTHTNEHWYLGADGKPAATGHHHHVLSAASGSWWSGPDDVRGIPAALATDGSPNGFHVLTVDGRTARTRLIPSHDPARSLLRIMLDSQAHAGAPEWLRETPAGAVLGGPITVAQGGSTPVLVNFFEGGPNSRVEMAVGAADFTPMRRITRKDPFVQDVYLRHPETVKPWVKPELSSHLWQGKLPAPLRAGTHRLTVRAWDEYGGAHHASMVLEIT